jgi:hypothetical protein
MAKGHMKRPQHGIRSTTPKPIKLAEIQPVRDGTHLLPQASELAIPIQIPPPHVMPNYIGPNLIRDEEDDTSIANVFCFGAFADKQKGVMYNDLTGIFPFISVDGSVCFLVMYHLESNAIFAIPIVGLDDVTIFEAYKKKFNELSAKGLKVKINIMDNQAMKHIKKFLNKEQCKLQRVEPHKQQNKRGRTSNSDMERCIHSRACYHQSRLPNPTVGQVGTSSPRRFKFAPCITN